MNVITFQVCIALMKIDQEMFSLIIVVVLRAICMSVFNLFVVKFDFSFCSSNTIRNYDYSETSDKGHSKTGQTFQ